jgi:hypothetical protein
MPNTLPKNSDSRTTDGTAFVALYGKRNGKVDVKASMSLSDDEPSLLLRDKNGKTLFSEP